jgi:hypothetical protein
MWLFSERSGSNVYRVFPRDIVYYHILPYLRVAYFPCSACGTQLRVDISIHKSIDDYMKERSDDSCYGLSISGFYPLFSIVHRVAAPRQPAHNAGHYTDYLTPIIRRPWLDDMPADRMLMAYSPWAALLGPPPPLRRRAPDPPPEPPPPAPGLTPAQLRAHFVAQERERERQQRQPYQPQGKGKGRKYQQQQGKRK